MTPKPCIFILEPTGVDGAMQANGTVYLFCSTTHRYAFQGTLELDPGQDFTHGVADEYVSGSVCDECGALLEQSTPSPADIAAHRTYLEKHAGTARSNVIRGFRSLLEMLEKYDRQASERPEITMTMHEEMQRSILWAVHNNDLPYLLHMGATLMAWDQQYPRSQHEAALDRTAISSRRSNTDIANDSVAMLAHERRASTSS